MINYADRQTWPDLALENTRAKLMNLRRQLTEQAPLAQTPRLDQAIENLSAEIDRRTARRRIARAVSVLTDDE